MTLHKKIPGLRFNVSRALFVLLVIFYALYVATTLPFPEKVGPGPTKPATVDSLVFRGRKLLQLRLEVAHISASHGHAIVEFFDIRSAQAGSGGAEFSWLSSLGSTAAGGCYGCCGVCRHCHGDQFCMWTTSEHPTCADAVGSCVGKRDTMVSCWGLKLLISWLLETRNCEVIVHCFLASPFFFFGDTAAQLFRKLQATSSLSFWHFDTRKQTPRLCFLPSFCYLQQTYSHHRTSFL